MNLNCGRKLFLLFEILSNYNFCSHFLVQIKIDYKINLRRWVFDNNKLKQTNVYKD